MSYSWSRSPCEGNIQQCWCFISVAVRCFSLWRFPQREAPDGHKSIASLMFLMNFPHPWAVKFRPLKTEYNCPFLGVTVNLSLFWFTRQQKEDISSATLIFIAVHLCPFVLNFHNHHHYIQTFTPFTTSPVLRAKNMSSTNRYIVSSNAQAIMLQCKSVTTAWLLISLNKTSPSVSAV